MKNGTLAKVLFGDGVISVSCLFMDLCDTEITWGFEIHRLLSCGDVVGAAVVCLTS